MAAHSPLFLLLIPIAWLLLSLPAYELASRSGVVHPGVAFIPGVGPYIVVLQSIKRSGWLVLLVLIPLISVVFVIWLSFAVPTEHRRTRWWALAFLLPVVNLIAFFAYAFTFDPYARSARPGGFASTYHVPPLRDRRR